jgi:Kef-type K+ transport system membrane component KefB
MSADAPKRTDLKLQRAWPPVETVEREETRREHATMAVLMAVCTVALLFSPETYLSYAGVLTAFIAGSAFQNWLSYPYVHSNGGDE